MSTKITQQQQQQPLSRSIDLQFDDLFPTTAHDHDGDDRDEGGGHGGRLMMDNGFNNNGNNLNGCSYGFSNFNSKSSSATSTPNGFIVKRSIPISTTSKTPQKFVFNVDQNNDQVSNRKNNGGDLTKKLWSQVDSTPITTTGIATTGRLVLPSSHFTDRAQDSTLNNRSDEAELGMTPPSRTLEDISTVMERLNLDNIDHHPIADESEFETASSEESDGISTSGDENHQTNKEDYIPLSSSIKNVKTLDLSTTINLQSFTRSHLVGKGGFGSVHLVTKNDTQRVYALKSIKKNHIIKYKSVINTLAEKDILKKVKHPFIVKLHYAFQDEKKLYLVMDFVNGGQLFYHLVKEAMFTEPQMRFYAAELILAIEHLHSLNIIHRDLKPENILLDSEGHIILTDFGLAKEEVTDDDSAGSFCGTVDYMAPEMLQRKVYGKSVDWWALGILMYYMIVGKPPFVSQNNHSLQDRIINEKLKFPKFVSPHARSLITSLLNKDPKKRLGCDGNGTQKIKQHAFFKPIQWHKLESREVAPPFVPKTTDVNDISNFDIEGLKAKNRPSLSTSPILSSSQQAFFTGFSFVRSPTFGPLN